MRDRGTVLEYRRRDAAEGARALPANYELEQQFLGALLINNDIFPAVSGFLTPEHFSEEIHRRIYLIATSAAVRPFRNISLVWLLRLRRPRASTTTPARSVISLRDGRSSSRRRQRSNRRETSRWM